MKGDHKMNDKEKFELYKKVYNKLIEAIDVAGSSSLKEVAKHTEDYIKYSSAAANAGKKDDSAAQEKAKEQEESIYDILDSAKKTPRS